MNPSYIAASITHTVQEKLTEYLITPFTNLFVILVLVIMFVNIYMFRKLWKMKKRDYMIITNVTVIGVYAVFSVISAVLVSRLGPHGTLKADDCDTLYMFIPRALFVITAVVNIVYFIVNICIKLKKDKEYEETIKRGYYAEESIKEDDDEPKERKHIDLSGFSENIKEKIDTDSIKEKVDSAVETVKSFIDKKVNKE